MASPTAHRESSCTWRADSATGRGRLRARLSWSEDVEPAGAVSKLHTEGSRDRATSHTTTMGFAGPAVHLRAPVVHSAGLAGSHCASPGRDRTCFTPVVARSGPLSGPTPSQPPRCGCLMGGHEVTVRPLFVASSKKRAWNWAANRVCTTSQDRATEAE